MPNVIDLFSGAGGLSLGAARAGFDIVAAVELDKQAIASHKTNFPNSIHLHKDIMMLSGRDLLESAEIDQNGLSGLVGGPPCQGFSSIGHGDVADPRNHLFIKFFQLVCETQPLFFVAENVPGIMMRKYDHIRDTAFSYVDNYVLLPPVMVNACEYGAPTTRTRIFFIGFRIDGNIRPFTIEDIERTKVNISERINVRNALEGLESDILAACNPFGNGIVMNNYFDNTVLHAQSDYFYQRVISNRPIGIGDKDYCDSYTKYHVVNGCNPTHHTEDVVRRFSLLAHGQRDDISKCVRLDPEKYCPTLRAGTGPEKGSYQAVRPIHFDFPRVITPREAARLQGFPDWYKLPDTIWHSFRQIGNSVSPIVAEKLLSVIFQRLM